MRSDCVGEGPQLAQTPRRGWPARPTHTPAALGVAPPPPPPPAPAPPPLSVRNARQIVCVAVEGDGEPALRGDGAEADGGDPVGDGSLHERGGDEPGAREVVAPRGAQRRGGRGPPPGLRRRPLRTHRVYAALPARSASCPPDARVAVPDVSRWGPRAMSARGRQARGGACARRRSVGEDCGLDARACARSRAERRRPPRCLEGWNHCFVPLRFTERSPPACDRRRAPWAAQGDAQDKLFVLTERLRFAVLAFDAASSEIVTVARGVLRVRIPSTSGSGEGSGGLERREARPRRGGRFESRASAPCAPPYRALSDVFPPLALAPWPTAGSDVQAVRAGAAPGD